MAVHKTVVFFRHTIERLNRKKTHTETRILLEKELINKGNKVNTFLRFVFFILSNECCH